MKLKKHKLSISLVEAVVVITIFAAIAATTGSILFTTTRSGRRLAEKAATFGDASWALDYMINEARWGRNFIIDPPEFIDQDVISFDSDIDHDGTVDDCVWYWRGFVDTPPAAFDYWDNTILYRGVDEGCGLDNRTSLQNATVNAQELTRFVIDNPDDPDNPGNPLTIFNYCRGLQLFRAVVTVQDSSTANSQTLRARATALNDAVDYSLDLLAHYPFEGNADDISGNNNNGNPQGGTLFTDGIINQAVSFDGTGYATCGDVLDFQTDDQFTFSAWIKTSTSGTIVSKWNVLASGGDGGYHFEVRSGGNMKLTLALFNDVGDAGRRRMGDTLLNDNQWHHVAATYDGSNNVTGIRLFVDGFEESYTTLLNTDPGVLTSSDFRIGEREAAGLPFNGLIDDVRIYGRVLSLDEIIALYQQGAGCD